MCVRVCVCMRVGSVCVCCVCCVCCVLVCEGGQCLFVCVCVCVRMRGIHQVRPASCDMLYACSVPLVTSR